MNSPDAALKRRVERLINDEVMFLNQGDLDSWIKLFSEDGYYWMPLEAAQESPHEHDSLIYDNRALMEMRRDNLGHVLSPSMQVPVRSVRVLSALRFNDFADRPNSLEVTTSVIAVIYHRRQYTLAGNVTYTIVGGDEPRIYCKRVDLINSDGVLDAIMMYV